MRLTGLGVAIMRSVYARPGLSRCVRSSGGGRHGSAVSQLYTIRMGYPELRTYAECHARRAALAEACAHPWPGTVAHEVVVCVEDSACRHQAQSYGLTVNNAHDARTQSSCSHPPCHAALRTHCTLTPRRSPAAKRDVAGGVTQELARGGEGPSRAAAGKGKDTSRGQQMLPRALSDATVFFFTLRCWLLLQLGDHGELGDAANCGLIAHNKASVVLCGGHARREESAVRGDCSRRRC